MTATRPQNLVQSAFSQPSFSQLSFSQSASPSVTKLTRHMPAQKGWLAAFGRHASRWQSGFSLLFALFVIGSAGLYGAVRGGQYDAFIATNGSVQDNIARALGFGISAITISSQGSLSETQILATAGVNPNSSLVFLDAGSVRDRLMALPVVADAQVRKLYPDRLTIELTERQPFALWQKDGQVNLISENGTVIGTLTDLRFADLPFVVGDGANTRAAEFLALLGAAGDQKNKFRAGIYIGERRWNLKTTNGVDVKLPDQNPQEALKALAELERQTRILEKDVIIIDMRVPGKVIARLTESAASTRTEHSIKKKSGSDI